MPSYSMSSQLFEQLQIVNQDIDTNPLAYQVADLYAAELDQFSTYASTFNPTVLQLSSTLVQLRFPGIGGNYTLSMAGSGIGPVSSLQALMQAIDTGVATGSFSLITLVKGTTTIGTIAFDATGYTLTTGPDVYRVTGTLPSSFADLTDLVGAIGANTNTDLSLMTPAQRTAFFNNLAAWGITGLSVETAGNTLVSFAVTPTTATLSAAGATVTLTGTFPTDFGQLISTAYDIYLATDVTMTGVDLSALPFLGIDSLTVTAPNGATVLSATGPFTDAASFDIPDVTFDGILRPGAEGLILGDWDTALDVTGLAYSEWFFGSIHLADRVAGEAGNDVIHGFGGDDDLSGGAGNDSLVGGDGNDVLNGLGGRDTMIGGDGVDTVLFQGRVGVTVNLGLTTNQNTGHGTDLIREVENVFSFAGADRLTGDAGRNFLKGGNNDDTLHGGAGIDTLNGGAGNDVLTGGDGVDVLFGAQGADRFQFTATSGRDIVMDFEDGIDRLAYSGGVTFGALSITQVGLDTFVTLGTSSIRLMGTDALTITQDDFAFL